MIPRSRVRAEKSAWPARALVIAIFAVVLFQVAVFAVVRFQGTNGIAPDSKASLEEFTISGPFLHDNLTVFLIHGKDRVKPDQLLTLQEALEQNKAIVHETSQVNELQVENVSEDVEVFIQSGDIVKGGKQDRLISFDVLLPPESGKVAVASCCVEQGRWQQRGKEAVAQFTSSTGQLPSKMLKVCGGNYCQLGGQLGGQIGGQIGGVGQMGGQIGGQMGGQLGGQFGGQLGGQFGGQLGGQFGGGQGLGQFGQLGGQFGGQGGVWMEVGQLQTKLQARLGTKVQSKDSESSLQLTLEHPKVKEAVENYTRELSPLVAGQKDVIGYAFAVNGQLNSVEVYGNAELFGKLWPKLLKANALEAFIEQEEGKTYPTVKAEAVKAVLEDTEQAEAVEKDTSQRVRVMKRETEKNVLFETRDRDRDVWVHRSYLTK